MSYQTWKQHQVRLWFKGFFFFLCFQEVTGTGSCRCTHRSPGRSRGGCLNRFQTTSRRSETLQDTNTSDAFVFIWLTFWINSVHLLHQHSFRFVLHESLFIAFSLMLSWKSRQSCSFCLNIKYHVVESAGDSVDQHCRDEHHHQRRRLRPRLLQVSVSEQRDGLKVSLLHLRVKYSTVAALHLSDSITV